MSNIIEFPKQKTQVYSLNNDSSPAIPTQQAVNELTCELLAECIPIYIDNNWSLGELDLVVEQFQFLMISSAPKYITRDSLNDLKSRLRPLWRDLLSMIRIPK